MAHGSARRHEAPESATLSRFHRRGHRLFHLEPRGSRGIEAPFAVFSRQRRNSLRIGRGVLAGSAFQSGSSIRTGAGSRILRHRRTSVVP